MQVFLRNSSIKFKKIFLNNNFIYNRKINTSINRNNNGKKFKNLIKSKWFINLASKTIPSDVIDIAILGRKHSIYEKLDNKTVTNTIKNVEITLANIELPYVEKQNIRKKVIRNLRIQ